VRVILLLTAFLLCPGFAQASWDEWEDDPNVEAFPSPRDENAGIGLLRLFLGSSRSSRSLVPSPGLQAPLLGPIQTDAYGLGVHSDATGRSFKWVTQDGQSDPLMRVKPNAYGLGVGMDQFGRPVRAQPFP